MSYCPQCGEKVSDDTKFCPKCGYSLQELVDVPQPRTKYNSNLSHGLNLVLSSPKIFVPSIAKGTLIYLMSMSQWFIFTILFDGLTPFTYEGIPSANYIQSYFTYPQRLLIYLLITMVFFSFGVAASGLLTFLSIHMIWSRYADEYNGLMGSLRYCLKNFKRIVAASLAGELLSVIVIPLPAVILIYVGVVTNGLGISDALSRGFTFGSKRIGVSALIVVTYLVLRLGFSYLSIVGDIIYTISLR